MNKKIISIMIFILLIFCVLTYCTPEEPVDYLQGTWLQMPENKSYDGRQKFIINDVNFTMEEYDGTGSTWDKGQVGTFKADGQTITVDISQIRGEGLSGIIDTSGVLETLPYTNSGGDVYHSLQQVVKHTLDESGTNGLFGEVYIGGNTSSLEGTWKSYMYFTMEVTPSGGSKETREMIMEATWVISGTNIDITSKSSYMTDGVHDTGSPIENTDSGTISIDTNAKTFEITASGGIDGTYYYKVIGDGINIDDISSVTYFQKQ